MSRPSKAEKAKRRARRRDDTVTLPPHVLAKLLESASLMLLAEVVRQGVRDGKTIVITFGEEGPRGKVLAVNPYPDPPADEALAALERQVLDAAADHDAAYMESGRMSMRLRDAILAYRSRLSIPMGTE